MLKNLYVILALAFMSLLSFGAYAQATVYDGITAAVGQPLLDAATVIVAVAGLAVAMVIVYKVSKMLIGFVRSF